MTPTLDDVQEMVGALMNVVNGIERAKRQGQAGNIVLLQALAAHEQARPSELSVELGLHQSSITRQVQALSAAGHVDVLPDPDDGRSCFVQLTDSGRAELLRLAQLGLARFSAYVDDWDVEEVQTFTRLLNKLERSRAETNSKHALGGRRWQQKAA
jgi:DNA-binding MarR family transcriptional regulator